MRTRLLVFVQATILMAAAPTAWSLGDGPAPVPANGPPGSQQTPENQARLLYNDGIDVLRRADNAAAATPPDSSNKAHAADEARSLYSIALGKFERAVRLDPNLQQAWNYVGYSHRKLGDYDEALEAYERALALQPGYPEAIEYRAEAYLAVGRFADAKQSYLDLFATNRAVAGKLLEAMKSWIAAQRPAASGGSNATGVNELEKWVQERAQIAAQTASLTREGTAASWK